MDIERGPGPLDGVRVLDLTRVLAGPHCTRMLSDLGALVIKVEPPDGDGTRLSFPKMASIATYFSQQNCGKENISIDLQQPAGVDLVLQLINHVDILVENFRPDVMDRLGLGWEELHARNPRLILASISGYGRGNAWSNRRAYAPVVSAEMGVTDLQANAHHGDVGSDPISHADLYTSLECLSGVLAALYQRERTGNGQRVEVSMAETMLSVNEHMHWILARDIDGISEANIVPSYRTEEFPVVTARSGEKVLIAGHPAADGNFQPLCLMMQRPDLLHDPSLATVGERRAGLQTINEALSAWAVTIDTVDELVALVDRAGFAVGMVRTVTEAATSAWAVGRGAIVEIDNRNGGTLRIPNSPIRFSSAEAGVRGSVRYRGEDNRSVLSSMLGMTDQQVDDLEASGVLSSRLPKAK